MKTLGAAVLTSLALLPVRGPTMGPEPPDGNPPPPGNVRTRWGAMSVAYRPDTLATFHVSIAINQRGGFEMEGSSGKSLSYIVGGSSGMGLATARLLVADGGTVVLVARKGELEAGGRGKVETITADFYDAGAVKSLIAKIDGETRHINHLVNAAG